LGCLDTRCCCIPVDHPSSARNGGGLEVVHGIYVSFFFVVSDEKSDGAGLSKRLHNGYHSPDVDSSSYLIDRSSPIDSRKEFHCFSHDSFGIVISQKSLRFLDICDQLLCTAYLISSRQSQFDLEHNTPCSA
jgi:hypothetical protein